MNFFKKLFGGAVISINNSSFLNWFRTTRPYSFLVIFKNKLTSSILFFSVLVLWGSISLAATRFFYMWYFDQWQYWNLYLYSVVFSFAVSLILIWLRYIQIHGFFQRTLRNSERWKLYHEYLIKRYDIAYVFTIRRVSWLCLTISSIFVILSGSASVLPCLFLFPLGISQLIICYYGIKTPLPDELLLEPPIFFEKFCRRPLINKILVRHYSSKKGATFAFSGGSKVAWYGVAGVGAVVGSLIGSDQALASYTGETAYGTRIYDLATEGWVTNDRKARDRIKILEAFGYEKSDFIGNDGRLKTREIHKTYNEWKNSLGSVSEEYRALEAKTELLERRLNAQRSETERLKKIVEKKEGGIN